MASDKTNVMRVLEQHKIAYKPHEYPHGKDAVDGVSVAELLVRTLIRSSRRWLHVANRRLFMYSLFRSQRSLT